MRKHTPSSPVTRKPASNKLIAFRKRTRAFNLTARASLRRRKEETTSRLARCLRFANRTPIQRKFYK